MNATLRRWAPSPYRLRILHELGILLVIRALITLILTERSLRRTGFTATVGRMGLASALTLDPARVPGTAPSPAATNVVRAVHLLGPRSGATCLPQSLAAARLLARIDITAQVRIGVASLEPGQPLNAHAWVEVDGVVVGEFPLASFHPFDAERMGKAITTLTTRAAP